jgi:predicted choloylglycine hydrolase
LWTDVGPAGGEQLLDRSDSARLQGMAGRILDFTAVDVGDGTGGGWLARARAMWPAVAGQLRDECRTPAGEAAALDLFRGHMPELVPVLERLAGLLDRPGAAAALTHTGYKSPFTGCSQAAVAGALVRNYDFHPDKCDRTIVSSRFLRPVIGMGELLWGMLDGMNDAGLAVSLTFGGRPVAGPGFDILLIVRYLLETCTTARAAWQKLRLLPVANPQNLTLVDGREALVVHIGPDRAAALAGGVCTTNHQDGPVPPGQEEVTATGRRLAALGAAVAAAADAPDPAEAVVGALLRPPLYQTKYEMLLGTLYTAAYRPAEGRVSYVWPRERWEQSFAHFAPGTRKVSVGTPR